MGRSPLFIALPFILCFMLIFRSNVAGPSAAPPVPDVVHNAPVTVTPAAGAPKEEPAPPRYLPEPPDLLAARVALGCGTGLLEKARHSEGPLAAALLDLAAEQFRECLRHETAVGKSPLFADARQNLEAIASLTAPPPSPPPPAPVKAPVVPPKTEARPEAKKAEPLMVGPDGVIYHRTGNKAP
jgi:hypothetical protein